MKPALFAVAILLSFNSIAQQSDKITKESILAEISMGACSCIDSINVYDKTKPETSMEISKCISDRTNGYQLAVKLLTADSLGKNVKGKKGKKEINISVSLDENSKEYRACYYEIERYLMNNCKSLHDKIASNNKPGKKSFSDNKEAYGYYLKGLEEAKSENYRQAIEYYKSALKIDADFTFAWDNLGICYRKANELDSALIAYKKSLEIDPDGLMPLQNIAIVYQYKKEYKSAVEAYERLALVDKNNPEVYYGIGQIYALNLNDYEKGLENLCKAYNLYVEQKSPYRTDAEKIIQTIYTEMKKQGKEDRFYEILKNNNITPSKN